MPKWSFLSFSTLKTFQFLPKFKIWNFPSFAGPYYLGILATNVASEEILLDTTVTDAATQSLKDYKLFSTTYILSNKKIWLLKDIGGK
jgi:hypothetical protein